MGEKNIMERYVNEQKIKEITQKIVNEFKPEKIILFGSYAWGNPGADSDVDLLIVVKSYGKSRVELQREVRSFLFPAGVSLDLLVYARDELEARVSDDRNLFLEDIVLNGRVLYTLGSVGINLPHPPAELIAA